MATTIIDVPDFIEEYRKKIKGIEDFVQQLKTIESHFDDIDRLDNLSLILNKFNEVMGKANLLTDCLSEYDNLLARYQQRVREYEDIIFKI